MFIGPPCLLVGAITNFCFSCLLPSLLLFGFRLMVQDVLSADQARANVVMASEVINDDISLGNGDTTEDEDVTSAGTVKSAAKKHNLSYKLAEQVKLSGSLLPSQVCFWLILV